MKTALIDIRASEKIKRRLNLLGFKVIPMPPSPALPLPLASHPDMLTFYSGGELMSFADYCENAPYVFTDIREYTDTAVSFTDESPKDKYPYDAIFNALRVNDMLFTKQDTVSPAILELAKRQGLKTVNVRQGYPSCTVLAFGDSAVTADMGMADALSENGINVTLIENGSIELPPYEYGFIGGATGVYGDKVYFAGDLNTHPSKEIIKKAITDAGFLPVCLSDEPLVDLGKIIFID